MRAGILVLVACLCTASIAAGQPSFTDLLDRYLAGSYDEAVAEAATRDLSPLQRIFTTDVPSWIGSGPDAGQRGAAAAAFLLELMDARMTTDFARFVEPLEAVCARLRAEPARTSFELIWHHASVALIGRARGERLLSWSRSLPHPMPAHLDHALARFPDETTFELARVMAVTWGSDDEPDRNGDAARRRGWRRNEHTDVRAGTPASVLAQLQRLANDPHAGGEAILRSGQLYLTLGRPADALRAFDEARQRTTTPQIRYLTFFLTGRALMALQRPADARRAYADALGVLPHAESASVALAALQFVDGDPAAAAASIERGFSTPAADADPGRLVGYGDYMYWPEWRAALRAELRK